MVWYCWGRAGLCHNAWGHPHIVFLFLRENQKSTWNVFSAFFGVFFTHKKSLWPTLFWLSSRTLFCFHGHFFEIFIFFTGSFFGLTNIFLFFINYFSFHGHFWFFTEVFFSWKKTLHSHITTYRGKLAKYEGARRGSGDSRE